MNLRGLKGWILRRKPAFLATQLLILIDWQNNQNAKLYKYYEVLIVACVRVVLQKTTEGKHWGYTNNRKYRGYIGIVDIFRWKISISYRFQKPDIDPSLIPVGCLRSASFGLLLKFIRGCVMKKWRKRGVGCEKLQKVVNAKSMRMIPV